MRLIIASLFLLPILATQQLYSLYARLLVRYGRIPAAKILKISASAAGVRTGRWSQDWKGGPSLGSVIIGVLTPPWGGGEAPFD